MLLLCAYSAWMREHASRPYSDSSWNRAGGVSEGAARRPGSLRRSHPVVVQPEHAQVLELVEPVQLVHPPVAQVQLIAVSLVLGVVHRQLARRVAHNQRHRGATAP